MDNWTLTSFGHLLLRAARQVACLSCVATTFHFSASASENISDEKNSPRPKIDLTEMQRDRPRAEKKDLKIKHLTTVLAETELKSSLLWASLRAMTELLFRFSKPGASAHDLIQTLTRLNQNPFIVDNSNGATGEMIIIRTFSPPVGTRYFHAQYLGANRSEMTLQHMSFEFRAGDDSMSLVTSAVLSIFSSSAKAKRSKPLSKDSFHEWSLASGFTVWVKKLDLSDLADDPFNAYSSKDTGVIRVAIEINPIVNFTDRSDGPPRDHVR